MGARKRLAAESRKAALKTQYFAKLNDCPSSPRKMRYVVDMVRGMEVNRASARFVSARKLLRTPLSCCCVLQSPTGKKRTIARPKKANSS